MILLKPDDIFSRLYPPMPADNRYAENYKEEMDKRVLHNHTHSHSHYQNDNPTPFPKETPLAAAFVYFQQWGKTYPPDEALDAGTLFPDLCKPFEGGRRR